jgi:thioredoxin reductase/bacterioferritin-associated ferredoxin
MNGRVFDLVVIGAGPAGMRASARAVEAGLSTVLLDEQSAPGGQIYRAITTTPLLSPELLGSDYWHGAKIVADMRSANVLYEPNSTVWGIFPSKADGHRTIAFDIAVSRSGASHVVRAGHVIVAAGALERPFPIGGWTLPGVVTAGAAQILLKSSGIAPSGHTILAGTGPLLYLLAAQLIRAGTTVQCLLDTTPKRRWRSSLPMIGQFAASPYLRKGLTLLAFVRRRIRVIRDIHMLEAIGESHVESVRYQVGGRVEELQADNLLLHQGVVPNISLSNAIGCAHRWDEAQACFIPKVDEWGTSTIQGITIAGDGAGIGGARVAEARGTIAAFNAAYALGRITANQRLLATKDARKQLALWSRGRIFIDAMYLPRLQFRRPQGDTIVCRCEEISARQVIEAIKLGCHGPNQLKSYLRCGMGPCQGRYCGLTVTELFAQERHVSPDAVGSYRLRFPIKPIPLGELADLPQTEASRRAVVRISG